METTLNLQRPTLVLLGAWNPAILTDPAWLAKFIFGVPEGSNVTINIAESPQLGQRIFLFKECAIGMNGPRLEFYSYSEKFNEVINAASKVCDFLKHTPVGGFGVNFTYNLVDDGTVGSLLSTAEGLETVGEILSTVSNTQLKLQDGKILNFSRQVFGLETELDFNFHYQTANTDEITQQMTEALLEDSKAAATTLLEKIYNIEKTNLISFNV